MGRVKLDDLEKYNTGGGGNSASYFMLKDDGDTESVRIMLKNEKDLENYIYATHKVTVGEKAKYPNKHVSCLRTYSDPIDDCPLCASGNKPSVRMFLPVYNVAAEEVQFFDRPKSYVAKIQKLLRRYKNLSSHLFDIERNGERNDKQTTYEFYETDEDDTTLDDLPEIPDVLGAIVAEKSADDMEYFLEAGEFPPEDDDDKPVKRRNKKKDEDEDEEDVPFDEDDEDEEEEQPRRRTKKEKERPSKKRRHRDDEDEF